MDAATREIWTKDDAPKSGCGSWDFQRATSNLIGLIGGEINYDETTNRWYFEKQEFNKKERYAMGATSEGIKKIAVLDRLLKNGYLNENSIIFIDEPESTLHPEAISTFLNIIAILAKHGIQFFIASHSYFVIKKLFLIAQEQKLSIPVLSYENNEWLQSDLKDEMPDNPIINESIRLYEEEVDLAFK
jgi:AAA15 family ATPase/GTPase